MKYLKTLSFILLLSITSFAQKYTISGYVEENETGEKLFTANVYDEISKQGTITNNYGFFSLTLPKGEVKLIVSFIGCKPVIKEFTLDKDISLNLSIESSISIDEVTVVGERTKSKVEDSQMGLIQVPIKTIKSLPALLGEVDIIKTIQLLPGVQSGSEGSNGLYVRGGGPDQNLILLDGVPVYNVNHLFGFFSVFNANAINSVSLIKGGFPARYGGRLSSVLDIRMKEGSMKNFKGEVSIGIISSKFTLEGPIIKDKTSFIISARRTYIDVLAAPLISMVSNNGDVEKFNIGYFFYDFNAKINHKFSDKSRLFLSAYTGRDKFYMEMKDDYFGVDSKLQWGNITTALRWNYISPL